MFIIDFRNKKVSQYGFSVVNNNDTDVVQLFSNFAQYIDYLVYLKIESEDKSYVDEILIDSEDISIQEGALLVKWTMGAISTQCKKIYLQLEFRESNEENSKVAQTGIVSVTLGDTIDTSEGSKHLYPKILQELQRQIDELKVGSVADFSMTYASDVLSVTLFNEEHEAVASLQVTIPTDNKVDKIAGKGLSTNDFTDALKNKLDAIANGAQVNVLEGVQVDGADLPIDANKKVNIANKVTKTDNADKVYGTDGSGNQTTLPVDNAEGKDGNIARRKQTSGQVSVPTTPVANDDATSKQYVDAFGKTIELTVDPTTYVLTAKLKDANGNVLATQTVDLPLESVVVGGSYDAQTQSIILTLQNGSTITIPVAGLISGLVSQTDFNALALRVTTAEGDIITLGNTKVNYSDITISGGFVIAITKNGSTYPIAEVVNISATPVVVQSTTDLPSENDGNLYVVLDNGYLYAWSNGWQQLYEYTSDLLTITEVTAGEVIYSYISDKGHSNRPIQVESAIRDGEGNIINETYAKKIGYEPRLSVGSADNINSDRQIDDPEASCPPTTMGITGGEAEIKTGIENFEYMEGKSKKFNQLVNPYGGSEADFTVTINNGKYTIAINNTSGAVRYARLSTNFNLIGGHKYYFKISPNVFVGQSATLQIYLQSPNNNYPYLNVNEGNAKIISIANSENNVYIGLQVPIDLVYTFNCYIQLFDLTAMFGAGNEPTIDEFKAKYPLDYYAYNAGEILSAKASKLISRGRQQWDEECSFTGINANTGQIGSWTDRITSANFIPAIPNQEYHFEGKDASFYIRCYDVNHNWLGKAITSNGYGYVDATGNFTTLPATAYIKFASASNAYGTTYHHDITISIYFEDGEGYDKYYAYSAQEVTLPNIELRSIGDIKDIAYAQGGGKRRLGYVDLGEIEWNNDGDYWFAPDLPTSIGGDLQAICSRLTCSGYGKNRVYNEWALSGAGYFEVYAPNATSSDDVKTLYAGYKLLYELEEEQDIPTSENAGWTEQVLVDNYGTLQFVTDPQQVPQVEQPYFIRYTIDLKEFLDGTYTHAQGDPQNLALKEDVENLKEDIERGDVVAGKSETADNLTPYSEDSGTTQTVPFINQGTGCGNGETQVDTGSLALMKNKQGNLVIGNQRVNYSSISTSGGQNGIEFEVDRDKQKIHAHGTATADVFINFYNAPVIVGHKILCFYGIKSIPSDYQIGDFNNGYSISSSNVATVYELMSTTQVFALSVGNGKTIDITFTIISIDLTQMFGSNDNIPPYLLAHPEAFFKYYQGSLAYNTGTPVSSNATKLKTIGRNLYNKATDESGYIDNDSGLVEETNDWKHSDYIKVLPNTNYYLRTEHTSGSWGAWYDKDKNYISGISDGAYNNSALVSPANACYLRITTCSASESWVDRNIVVSLYYEGESGYDQYYPYEVLTETNTGNEVLRSAGSVRDYKEPNGTIHRKVGRIDLGDLNYAYLPSGGSIVAPYFYASLPLAKRPIDIGVKTPNAMCPKYVCAKRNSTDMVDKTFTIDYDGSNPQVQIKDSAYTDPTAFKNAMTGVYLFYELAEETTEEGTPYAENVKVDDFGSMMWEGEGFNGVPMGDEIFYPIDYKAEMDTLHNHCDGDITSLVRQQDLVKHYQHSICMELSNGGRLALTIVNANSNKYTKTTFKQALINKYTVLPLTGSWLVNGEPKPTFMLYTYNNEGNWYHNVQGYGIVAQNINFDDVTWFDDYVVDCDYNG